ncbi:MAG: hypothetical protein NTX59_00540 [Elusimicrobia bacterium]|nr:hypothetical protein [Elusimicrobiota bacterium]
MGRSALLSMSFAGSSKSETGAVKQMRRTALLLSSLLIIAPGLAFSGQTALDALNTMAQTAPEAAPLPVQPVFITAPGTEVTGEYINFFENADARFDAAVVKKLKKYKVIFVPGFLSDVDPSQLHIPGIALKSAQHFEEQMKWLQASGMEYERLSMTSESSVKANSAIVSTAIRASSRPVILIGHSKGGLDTLEALISDRGLLKKVKGFVSLQSPFFGSPVADYVISNNNLNNLAATLLLSMGGNRDSMVNLTCADRKPYMAANAAAIADITATIPVIAVATWKDPVPGQVDTALEPVRDLLLVQGMRNDGVVPVDSALLPGANFVKLSGLDHGVTVSPSSYINFDRVKFIKALLLTLFNRLNPEI